MTGRVGREREGMTCGYLAKGFPGVPVGSAQAHHHVHSKPPHHVVLQIPVRRGRKFKETLLLTQSYDISVMGEQLFPLHALCSRPHKRTLTNRLLYTNTLQTHTHKPLGVSGQDKVESSVIVGGVVYDLLSVRNTDIDCVQYLCSEVTPVKYLQDKSKSEKKERKNMRKRKDEEKETTNSDR